MAAALKNIDVSGYGPIPYDSTALALPSAGGLTLVGLFTLGGHKEKLSIDILNGVSALTHLKLSRAGWAGGHAAGNQVDFATDAAVNTVTNDITSAAPASLSTLGAGINGSIIIGNLRGVQEVGLWAQCAVDTTVRLRGGAMDQSA